MISSIKTLGCFALLLLISPLLVASQEQLTPAELYEGLENGRFDALWDIRTQEEWDAGHLPGATHVPNLHSTGNADDLTNCENCTIAVYCRSGSRTDVAIGRLLDEYGFGGMLFNGLGVGPWEEANYTLVQTESVDPLCRIDNAQCTCCDERGPGGDSNSTSSEDGAATPPANLMVTILASLFFIPFL